MGQIKAIETIYNGYRFRSRLEARWAVFFDTLGVEYEYEPEGFDLGNGEKYLPDFLLSLPEGKSWFEIKHSEWEPKESDHRKLAKFIDGVDTLGLANFYLCAGSPYPNDYEFWVKNFELNKDTRRYEVRGIRTDSSYFFNICPLCQTVGIRPYQGKSYGEKWPEDEGEIWFCEYCDNIDRSHPDSVNGYFHKGHVIARPGVFLDNIKIRMAFLAARQARFEHGETPR